MLTNIDIISMQNIVYVDKISILVMRIIDRLDKYIESKGINDNQVTVSSGLSVGLLGKARQGKSDIGKKSIDKILNIYQDLNKTWLLTGEGEMLLDFTKGITGGKNPDIDREFNEINNELGVLGALLHANKKAKEVSDKFDEIRGKLIVVETYTKQYELLNRMIPVLTCYSQKQVKMNDVKEEFKANIEMLSEIVSILEPYSETISELFEKLSEFDNQHDKIFLIEE